MIGVPGSAVARRRVVDLRDNAFDAIRLALAGAVIVSHAFPVGGLGVEPHLGDIKLGTLAVAGFFAISGFLVTGSRLRTSALDFARRRFLRIFPGYWCTLLFTGFVAAWTGGVVRGGWSVTDAARYVGTNVAMFFGTALDPATLAGAPLQGSWNGSLWSLRYEVLCYVALGTVLGLAWVVRRDWLWPVALVASSLASMVVRPGLPHGFVADVLLVTPYFLAGVVFFFLQDRLPLSVPGAVLSLVVLALTMVSGVASALAPLPLVYLLVALAASLPQWLRNWGRVADLSYGTYLYGFPVQQLLVLAGVNRNGPAVFVASSLAATVPLAVLSWVCVERPAMRRRSRRRPDQVPGVTSVVLPEPATGPELGRA